jgi:hypothetical protein
LTVTAVGGGTLFALFTVLLVIQGGVWPLTIAVGAGWVVLCLWLARLAARAETAAVYCLSGPVRVRGRQRLLRGWPADRYRVGRCGDGGRSGAVAL